MSKCDVRIEDANIHEKDLSIGITFHHLGLIIAALTGLISIVIAQYLIFRHATHYLKPWEQKHIIRILFMIPVYSAVSFLSYYFFHHAIYFQVLRDCYEAFAIASFFTLLCNYIATSLHDQKDYFRTTTPRNWIWPLNWCQKCTGGEDRGFLRKPKSGLTWFNIIHVGVFQYCFIRVFFTIVSVATQAAGLYCQSSLSPAFSHIWVEVFEGVSVSIAMYTLIQFYVQLRSDLAPHKPFLKLLCIKLVIFFSFWQSLVISFLSSKNGPLKPTPYVSWPDISVGIPSVLLTIEMAMFAVLHLFAFPWRKPYGQPSRFSADRETLHAPGSDDLGAKPHYQGGFLGWKATLEAFNPWDIIKASARGFRWLFVGVRHRRQDISYQQPRPDGGYAGAPSDDGPPGYGSSKLQPFTGGNYPLNEAGTHHTTAYAPPHQHHDSSSYDPDARAGRWDRPARATINDPWTTESRFTPSPSPSPSPHPVPYAVASHEDDDAGLLQNAGAAAGTGRIGVATSTDDPPPQTPSSYRTNGQHGAGAQYGSANPWGGR